MPQISAQHERRFVSWFCKYMIKTKEESPKNVSNGKVSGLIMCEIFRCFLLRLVIKEISFVNEMKRQLTFVVAMLNSTVGYWDYLIRIILNKTRFFFSNIMARFKFKAGPFTNNQTSKTAHLTPPPQPTPLCPISLPLADHQPAVPTRANQQDDNLNRLLGVDIF